MTRFISNNFTISRDAMCVTSVRSVTHSNMHWHVCSSRTLAGRLHAMLNAECTQQYECIRRSRRSYCYSAHKKRKHHIFIAPIANVLSTTKLYSNWIERNVSSSARIEKNTTGRDRIYSAVCVYSTCVLCAICEYELCVDAWGANRKRHRASGNNVQLFNVKWIRKSRQLIL